MFTNLVFQNQKHQSTNQIPKLPVVLVHGIWDNGKAFQKISSHLEKNGYKTYKIDLVPNDGSVGIVKLAHQLKEFIDKNIGKDEQFFLIGFSLGGMVARYYLQKLNGLKRVKKFIAIASPHRGTWLANLMPNQVGNQLRPGSSFLKDLNKDHHQLGSISQTIGTPFDLMIIPAKSSVLFANKHQNFSILLHPLLLTSKKVCNKVLEILEEQ